jgi:hypothetical protein
VIRIEPTRSSAIESAFSVPLHKLSFDGDGHLFRLVSEAHRIRLAHLFDPVLAHWMDTKESQQTSETEQRTDVTIKLKEVELTASKRSPFLTR